MARHYLGSHWAWWLLGLATIAVVVWAFWRLAAERRNAHDRALQIVDPGAILRNRFARGEIGADELVDGMRALRVSRSAEFSELMTSRTRSGPRSPHADDRLVHESQ